MKANIVHESIFDPSKIEEHYTKQDGVPVKYVCTSALGAQDFATDVFYRETPHPEFGNRYFAVYRNMHAADAQVMITNADCIEDLEFGMVEDKAGDLHYSAHRHDYKVTDCGNVIDGGRAYIRGGGDVIHYYHIKDGEFVMGEKKWLGEDSGVENMS